MYNRNVLRRKINLRWIGTAGRNRGADIGYEPSNLGYLVPPITRKK